MSRIAIAVTFLVYLSGCSASPKACETEFNQKEEACNDFVSGRYCIKAREIYHRCYDEEFLKTHPGLR